MSTLSTLHGPLTLPAFLPDATRGVLRAVDSADVHKCGIAGLVVNALHLSLHPGTTTLSTYDGLHNFMNWSGIIASDSGGFQALSLIEAGLASVTKNGFVYRMQKGDKKRLLTPEKSIQIQFQARADLMYCLDLCTHPQQSVEEQERSVEFTIAWARRCKEEFHKQVEQRRLERAPLLFAVIQGGGDHALRRRCAEALQEIGFDGYGFGGWPFDSEGQLVDTVPLVAELAPKGVPLHALGVGKPESVHRAWACGYTIFDCVLPTRDARRKRLYAARSNEPSGGLERGSYYKYLYLEDEIHRKNTDPIDPYCDCALCVDYSTGYLHHLFQIDDHLAYRLATIHNLRFYARTMQLLAGSSREGA